ncbi:MAG: 3-methyladenine DNA glycosylase AlkC [Candidatus Azotimanducaceae bacterium]|jgi:3-methyladenine DNA glycosylase AlkC
MAELLKNIYNTKFIKHLGGAFKREYPAFDEKLFSTLVFDSGWQQKELKSRMRRITESLHFVLPSDYNKSIKIVVSVSKMLRQEEIHGFEYMLFPDFVECYGQEHWSLSIPALEELTKLASAEFAVRPYLLLNSEKMMKQMITWSKSADPDVRRLASEGCRPRLPWAMALPGFKKDPTLILKLLKPMRNDSALYVRRSVANNLNDISKDHPDLVMEVVKPWHGKNKNTDWLIRHGCRGLLKSAHPEALALFGFGSIKHLAIKNFTADSEVQFGHYLPFSFEVSSTKKTIGKLRLEYAIDFMKSNGKQARKIFQISESSISEDHKIFARKHRFKAISTRKHYTGSHGFSLILNGQTVDQMSFELLGPVDNTT